MSKVRFLNPSLLLLILLVLILLLRVDYDMFLYRPGIVLVDETAHLSELKSAIENNFSRILPQPQAGLLSGMVLGSKQALPEDFRQALISTSTIHIVVASGQNLTILSGFIVGLASIIGRKKAVTTSIGVNLFYAFLTGFQIPIIRAAFMNIFVSLGQLTGREASVLFALITSGLAMLIYEPLWLYSVSFQLSFLATFAVMEFAPAIENKFKWMPDILRNDLIVSVSAFLLTLPIIYENFGRVSVTGVIVNCLVVWITPLIMGSGGVVAILSLISLEVAAASALFPGAFLTYLIYIVNFFNTLSPSLEVESKGWVFWVGYYLVILAVYSYCKKTVGMEEE